MNITRRQNWYVADVVCNAFNKESIKKTVQWLVCFLVYFQNLPFANINVFDVIFRLKCDVNLTGWNLNVKKEVINGMKQLKQEVFMEAKGQISLHLSVKAWSFDLEMRKVKKLEKWVMVGRVHCMNKDSSLPSKMLWETKNKEISSSIVLNHRASNQSYPIIFVEISELQLSNTIRVSFLLGSELQM